MGFANIIWIDELPIRKVLTDFCNPDLMIVQQIGRSVMKLVAHDSNIGIPELRSTDFLDHPKVFNSAGVQHSSSFGLYIWSGQALYKFDKNSMLGRGSINDESDIDNLHFLARLDNLLPNNRLIKRMTHKEHDNAINSIMMKRTAKESFNIANGISSIYWIYEDWSRNYRNMDESKWPIEEVGKSILEMIESNLNGCAVNIGSYGACINKAATVISPQFSAFIWKDNCLQHIQDVELPTQSI